MADLPHTPAASLSYATWDSPLGTLLLGMSDTGLCHLDLVHIHDKSLLEQTHPLAQDVMSQLAGYFSGKRTTFSVPLDLSMVPPWRRSVLEQLQEVPYGDRVSYRDLAQATAHPRAARAVGGACATNPIPIIIPCHRVVRADGRLGNFSWGIYAKQYLLNMEVSRVLVLR